MFSYLHVNTISLLEHNHTRSYYTYTFITTVPFALFIFGSLEEGADGAAWIGLRATNTNSCY